MTTEQRDGIVQRVGRFLDERTALVRWHRQNACQKHGLPFEDQSELRVVIESKAPPAADAKPAAPTAEPSTTPVPPATKGGVLNWINGAPGWMKAAALLGGAYGANALYQSYRNETTVVEQPAGKSGSLLQYLEDNGQHLPPEGSDGQ